MNTSRLILMGVVAVVVVGGAVFLTQGKSESGPSDQAIAAGAPISYPNAEEALADVTHQEPGTRERAIIAYARRTKAKQPETKQVTVQQVEPLIERLKQDSSPVVRAAAATGLGTLESYHAVESLGKALEDPDAHVQERAKLAIARITGFELNFKGGGPEENHKRSLVFFHKVLMPEVRDRLKSQY